jgi:hypothetical protein
MIGGNARRMWSNFTGTTNGEWGQIVFAFALLPAQLASYVLPFYFLYRIGERWTRAPVIVGNRERRLRMGWGIYLSICGAVSAGLFSTDRFMLIQGAWELVCGIAVLLLGPSWWVSRQKPVFSTGDGK